jgi:uncharacterized membrane protein YkoI
MRNLPLLVVLLLPGCQSGTGASVAALQAADLGTMISLEDALAAAAGHVPGGTPISVVLELTDDDENEPPAWEVSYFVAGSNQIIDVEVDAHTGRVTEVSVEEDGPDDDGEGR